MKILYIGDIMGKPGQVVVLPDMAAGCSMSAMEQPAALVGDLRTFFAAG